MKKIVFIIIATFNLFTVAFVNAQTSSGKVLDDANRIILNTYVSDDFSVVPDYAQSYLKDKLNAIATGNGLGLAGTDKYGRFFLTAKPVFVNKEVVATTPAMYAFNVDVVFYIVDAIDKTIFETITINAKGAGNTENKAFTQAIRSVKASSPEMKAFLEKGKQKIIDFYTTNCDVTLQTAQSLANQNQYGEAYYLLSSVPSVARECYGKSLALAEKIFPQYIEFDCKTKLAEAKQIWNANMNRDAADRAGAILSQINPNSKCFSEAKLLGEEIKTRMKQVNGQEWDLYFKKEYDLPKASIQAIRDIGVAWGNGQPKTVSTTQVFKGWIF